MSGSTYAAISAKSAWMRQWGARHPFCYFTLPLVAWVVFVTWGSLTRPNNLPQLDFDYADKFEHATCYAILGILMLRGWVRGGWPAGSAGLLVVIVAALWGLYLEFMQRLTGYRTFDLWDAFWDGMGALGGVALWSLAIRRMLSRGRARCETS